VIESQSPYYLHLLEGLGVAITLVIFSRKNYDLWREAIRIALKAKNKLGFIEGTLTKSKPKKRRRSKRVRCM